MRTRCENATYRRSGAGLPLDFRTYLARYFTWGRLRPCGTVPPSPVTFGVHSPTLRVLRWLGAFHHKGDHMTDCQDSAHRDDESGIGNSKHD